MSKQKILYVEWVDSATTHGWQNSYEVASLRNRSAKCCSCGFLVRENKHELILAQNASADGTSSPYGDLIHIPLVCITLRKKL